MVAGKAVTLQHSVKYIRLKVAVTNSADKMSRITMQIIGAIIEYCLYRSLEVMLSILKWKTVGDL